LENIFVFESGRSDTAEFRLDAGAPKITPEMLKAGVNMIAEEWGICGADIAPDLARAVFLAMWAEQDKKDQEQNSSNS
jgi:hypothetical protein